MSYFRKVKRGFARKLPVVNPNWLRDCIYTWENVLKDSYLFYNKWGCESSFVKEKSGSSKPNLPPTTLVDSGGLSQMETFDKKFLLNMENEVIFLFLFLF